MRGDLAVFVHKKAMLRVKRHRAMAVMRERERGRARAILCYDQSDGAAGGMSRSTCPSESLIFGPRNQCLLMTSCIFRNGALKSHSSSSISLKEYNVHAQAPQRNRRRSRIVAT